MRFVYWFILVVGFLVLGIMFMDTYLNKAFGDYIEYNGHLWQEDPVFCIIKPTNMTAFEEYGITKYQMIKYVNLWKIKLNHYTDSKNWNYTTRFLNSDVGKGSCDTRIYFMESGKEGGAMGVIECYSYKKIPKTFCDITVFSKYLKADFVGSTITHEVGHALGLGHRLAYTPCDFAAVIVSFDIMMAQGGKHQKITNDDLNALIAIYGEDGFGGINNPVPDKYEITARPLKCA